TIIKFASIARKQRLQTVCLQLLSKLSAYNMPSAASGSSSSSLESSPGYSQLTLEPIDAFWRIREQVKTCLDSKTEAAAALAILNNTNIEYFTAEQKAEILRLKGEALQYLGYGDESNNAYSAALSVCDNYGRGWLTWGSFCDKVYTIKNDSIWADYAVVCY